MPFREGCFEVTRRCGYRCVHCSSNYGKGDDLSLRLLKEAIDDFRDAGGNYLELSGGDPTEREDFSELLEFCRGKFDHVTVFSNGTGCECRELAEALRDCEASLAVTVLGSRDTHNTLAGDPKSYDKTLSLYRECKERGVELRVFFVPMRQNVSDLPFVLERFPELKVLRLMPQGRAYENWSDIALTTAETCQIARLVFGRTGSHMTLPFCYQGKCSAGTEQFLVTPLGSVVPCASFKRYSIKLGNIREERLGYILSDANPRLRLWRRVKRLFSDRDTGGQDPSLVNNMCWGHYLHDGMKHPLSYEKMLREFGVFDADFSKWVEFPRRRYYVVGPHGVGKSTLIRDLSSESGLYFYQNGANNPYSGDVRRRQLWRLYKYKHDEEMLKTVAEPEIVVNRCPLDWVVYTKTFLRLGWLSRPEYDSLMARYFQLFGGHYLPERLVYLNPPKKWSLERLSERWEAEGMKWREDDLEYYDALREEYSETLGRVGGLCDAVELRETGRRERVLELGRRLGQQI